MTIDEALFTHVTADPDVASFIGQRFYAVALPQEAKFPAVTYQLMGAPRERAADGPNSAVTATFGVSAWARTHSEVRGLALALRKAFDGAHGFFGEVPVKDVEAEIGSDNWDDTLKIYGRTLQLTVQFMED